MYIFGGIEYHFDPKPGYILHLSHEMKDYIMYKRFSYMEEYIHNEIEVIRFCAWDSIVYMKSLIESKKYIHVNRYGWFPMSDGGIPMFKESFKRRLKLNFEYEYYVDHIITNIKIAIEMV